MAYIVYFHGIEEVRDEFKRQCYSHGSISGVSIKINVSLNQLYQVFQKRITVPSEVYRKLKLTKVVDGNRLIGYISNSENIEWNVLWQE